MTTETAPTDDDPLAPEMTLEERSEWINQDAPKGFARDSDEWSFYAFTTHFENLNQNFEAVIPRDQQPLIAALLAVGVQVAELSHHVDRLATASGAAPSKFDL